MKLATTTADFTRFVKGYRDSIRLIREAGFRYVDISIGGEVFLKSENWRDEAKELRDYAEKIGVKFIQSHSPGGNPLSRTKQDEVVQVTERAIEISEILGVPQIVVHPGWKKEIGKEEFFDLNLEFYKKIFPLMEKTGVNVLIENTSTTNLPGYYYFTTGKEMVEFLEYANHPLLHAVWDTGHGITEGNQYDQLVALGKELYGIHVHDNSGRGDEHALPYTGILNMDDVINGLIDADYKGYFTFEAIRILRESNSRHGARQVFEREQRLLEPTLEMQIDAERLLYTIGKYCLSAYDIFEE